MALEQAQPQWVPSQPLGERDPLLLRLHVRQPCALRRGHVVQRQFLETAAWARFKPSK